MKKFLILITLLCIPIIIKCSLDVVEPQTEKAGKPDNIEASSSSRVNIITWVPPYNWQACRDMLNIDFGGVKMEDGITHLALQFWGPVPSTGGIKYVDHEWQRPNDATVRVFTDWARGKDVKVMLCVYNNDGAWNWDIVGPIMSDPAKRRTHVNTLVSEVKRLGLDGVEVDYEWPGGSNSAHANFLSFIRDLSSELRKIDKELTIATFSYIWNYPNSDGWNDFLPYVDGITSMGYEEIGRGASGWASYSTQKTLINDPSKLMLGMPTYAGSEWQGNSVEEQIAWVLQDGTVGIGIWDASLADGSGRPNNAWRTASVWNKLKQIKGSGTSVPATYTISASAQNGGTISPSGSVTVSEGSSKSFSITPDSGYKIERVTVNGEDQGAVSNYTFTNIGTNGTITAYFTQTPQQFTINASAGTGGTISPSGLVTANQGESKAFTITPNSGYEIDYVTINGSNQGELTSYTFRNIRSNQSISAHFRLIPVEDDNDDDSGDCDSPVWSRSSVYTGGQTVAHNGYRWRARWWTQGDEPGTTGQWGVWEEIGPCGDKGEITVPEYTITAQAQGNGSIYPAGNINIKQGESRTFNITPNGGYEIDYVLVNGANKGAVSSYTFENVESDNGIIAYFRQTETDDNGDGDDQDNNDGDNGTGDGECSDIEPWSSSQNWNEYATGDLRTYNGKIYRCINVAFSFYDPSGPHGHFGWEFVADCN
ncbi:chitinase, GH18 family [Chitinispirillum alkaliphilum]|nr:chitinase, GH18 family [Chitinispirillum alkaliphilum]